MKQYSAPDALRKRALKLLEDWSVFADTDWYELAGHGGRLGCYSTGFNNWGVQTNQKYVSALALLGASDSGRAEWARGRALAALRFSLWSHVSGPGRCTDGTSWGQTWISPLGVERMMYSIDVLEPWLTDEDRAGIRRMLASECGWLITDYRRGNLPGLQAGLWNHEGNNHPENNLWIGAILWRSAAWMPEHPDAEIWREKARVFLINSVSVPDDAFSEVVVDGKPVRERYVGPNFFPNYALDHHGYLNVGYMVICTSNAAFLHFDCRRRGWPVPESLYHHQRDLWERIRMMIGDDGRLIRIGGDTRVRYAYCQEYLMPSLMFAEDQFRDRRARAWLSGQLDWIEKEAAANGDGSFFSQRLATLRSESLFYYSRLESDRACVLGMVAAYLPLIGKETSPDALDALEDPTPGTVWIEPEHGAVLVRDARRVASFSWRAAYYKTLGLCLPVDDSHLVEWSFNLSGYVRFANHPTFLIPEHYPLREVERGDVERFDGGFVASGCVLEGEGATLADGWRGSEQARHYICFVALPDGETVVGMQRCEMEDKRGALHSVRGMHWNIPNDCLNDFQHTLHHAGGSEILTSPVAEAECRKIVSPWLNVDGKLGAVGIYGAGEFVLDRSPLRRGGIYRTLHVDEVHFGYDNQGRMSDPGEVLLDVGWLVHVAAGAESTAAVSEAVDRVASGSLGGALRRVRLTGADGCRYEILANLSNRAVDVPGDAALPEDAVVFSGGREPSLLPGGIRVARF